LGSGGRRGDRRKFSRPNDLDGVVGRWKAKARLWGLSDQDLVAEDDEGGGEEKGEDDDAEVFFGKGKSRFSRCRHRWGRVVSSLGSSA